MSRSVPDHDYYDTVIIGGGFFGCVLALSMAARSARVLILEKESSLLKRASFANQARVHNGYHYPRSLITAMRSAFNYPRFLEDFEDCLDRTFLQVYAIARGDSRVNAYQYKKFCERVGIPLWPLPARASKLFNTALIEEAFAVEECAFDALRLRDKVRLAIEGAGVEIAYEAEAKQVVPGPADTIKIQLRSGAEVCGKHVWNCTYSDTNNLLTRSGLPRLPLKYQTAEVALIRVPPELEKVGITVMDGPFFSTMPFPALGLHSLTHVTYTPQHTWSDGEENRGALHMEQLQSKSIYMLHDARRYVPAMRSAAYVKSIFQTKTILLRTEIDDARPILFRRDWGLKNFSVVLGAKIDNIYDILKSIDTEVSFRNSANDFHYQARGVNAQ
jgi:glycine/D-amino acid oxidase-like deaminating enzyme